MPKKSKTFCPTYNEMFLKMARSKTRKDFWVAKIQAHGKICPICKNRTNNK